MSAYIYILTDPVTDECRYVGKSINPEKRFKRHILEAKLEKPKRHLYCWIKSLLNKNLVPIMTIIDEVDNWAKWEKFYIDKYKNLGCKLTNLCEGGQGSDGYNHTDEWKEDMSIKMKYRKPWNTGKHLSDLHKKKISNGSKGRVVSESTREKIKIGNINTKRKYRRFTLEDIINIRESKLSNRKLAKIYNCSYSTINLIKLKRIYSDI